MRLRAVAAHALPDLVAAQHGDHGRADEQGEHQRGERGQDAAQGEVLEDVKAAVELREIFGQGKQHQLALIMGPDPPPPPVSACTTRSSRLMRDPLISTVTPGASSDCNRRVRESASANHSPPEPKVSTARELCEPSANRRLIPQSRAYAPMCA